MKRGESDIGGNNLNQAPVELKGVSPFDFGDVPVIDGVNHPDERSHHRLSQ